MIFRDAWDSLHFLQKVQIFTKTTVPIFKKMVPMKNLAALLCAGIFHIFRRKFNLKKNDCTDFQKMVSLENWLLFHVPAHLVFFPFTSRSTAFEGFNMGIFGLFVLNFLIFSSIKCINAR